MPAFPLGQTNDDRVTFNPATQIWERKSDAGGGEIDFSGDTVQDLKTLTTADDVEVGSIGLILGTGNLYRAISVTAIGSTWAPATGIWYDGDFGAALRSSVAQLAMDEALLTGFPGVVQLRAGLYNADVTLVLYSNMILRGMGYRSTLLRGTLGAPYIRTNAPGYAASPTVVRCAIRDLGIDTAGAVQAGSIGIDVRNTQVFAVSGVHVGLMETGIRVGDETRTGVVENSETVACTTGVHFDNGVRSCGVEKSRINGGTTGVLISAGADSSTSHVWVERNTIGEPSGHCVLITDTPALPVIQTNICRNRIESVQVGAIGVQTDVDTIGTNIVDNHIQSVNIRVNDLSAFGETYSRENSVQNRLQLGSMRDGERRGSLSDFALPEREVYSGFCEDWLGGGAAGTEGQTNWREANTGGGVAAWFPTGSTSQHPGVIFLRVPNNPADASTVRKDDSFVSLGGGIVRVEMVVQLPVLPDGINPFAVRLGLLDVNAGDANDGVYFQGDDASGNWFVKTAAGGAITSQDSGVAMSAGSWVVLAFKVNAAAGGVEFFIDGVSVGTISTNIPSGAQLTTPALQIQRDAVTAGTANRDLYVDFYQYGQRIESFR